MTKSQIGHYSDTESIQDVTFTKEMYSYFDHAIYINGHADDFFIGKETKTKT